MSANKGTNKSLLGTLGFAFLAMGVHLPASAQEIGPMVLPEAVPFDESDLLLEGNAASDRTLTLEDLQISNVPAFSSTEEAIQRQPDAVLTDEALVPTTLVPTALTSDNLAPGNLAAENPDSTVLTTQNLTAENLAGTEEAISWQAQQPLTAADALAFPANAEPTQLAQARRRTRNNVGNSSFIGVGVDFGSAENTSFAIISKFALSQNVSIRPSVLIGDDFGVLVPVAYDFNQYVTDLGGFQLQPYLGLGASYIERSNNTTTTNNSSDFGALISAGVDIPIGRQIVGNVQANYSGIFSDDTNFGVTLGVGYSFGGLR